MGRAVEDAQRYLNEIAKTIAEKPDMPKEAIQALYLQGIMLSIADLTDTVERMTYFMGDGNGD